MRNHLRAGLLALGLGVLPAHAQPPASPPAPPTAPASVALPAELDRVLRDYEARFSARDAAGLAALFTEDGWVLSPGRPPVRGRAAIAAHYASSGGPLFLRAFSWASDGRVGYILGAYALGAAGPDEGKFTLTLRKVDERWLIASDMDNGNREPR